MGINRRSFMRASAGAAVGGVGLAALGGSANAWDFIETTISCPSCEPLVKFEVTDQSKPAEIEVATDFGVIDDKSDFSVNDNTYTLQPGGVDVDARIRLTPEKYKDSGAELTEVNFTSDALICEAEVEDGNKGGGTKPVHNYYTNRDLPVIRGKGLKIDDSSGNPKGISNIRFYYCPSVEVKTERNLNITNNVARFGIYYAPFHPDDEEVYSKAASPDSRIITSSDEYVYTFNSPYKDVFINDPLEQANPSNMKAEFVVDSASNNGQGYVDETKVPPGETDDFTE